MTKFNVGDKVRVINQSHGWGTVSKGDEGEIVSINHDGTYEVSIPTFQFDSWTGEEYCFELISPKPTKNQRITALENEVAELKLIVHELRERPQLTTVVNNVTQGPSTTNTVEDIIEFEGAKYCKVEREAREGDVVIFRKNTSICVSSNKPYLVSEVLSGIPKFYEEGCRYCVYSETYNRTFETTDVYELIESKPLTPNQQRAAIIEKAKQFIDEAMNQGKDGSPISELGNETYQYKFFGVEFDVNESEVKAFVYQNSSRDKRMKREPIHVSVAKCSPNDVFNKHIGKAIALGRALGLDVSEFEQAVRPNRRTDGMVIEWRGRTRVIATPHVEGETCDFDSEFARYGTIINDTNAIYEEGQ